MTKQSFAPTSFITTAAIERLEAVPINPWDVMTAGTFLDAMGIEDRMQVNRWHYRRPKGLPPFEPVGRWRAGPGAPRVIRKDRALAWARSGGVTKPPSTCWPMASAALWTYGYPNLDGPGEVQEVLNLLLGHSLISLAIPLKKNADIQTFYVDQ